MLWDTALHFCCFLGANVFCCCSLLLLFVKLFCSVCAVVAAAVCQAFLFCSVMFCSVLYTSTNAVVSTFPSPYMRACIFSRYDTAAAHAHAVFVLVFQPPVCHSVSEHITTLPMFFFFYVIYICRFLWNINIYTYIRRGPNIPVGVKSGIEKKPSVLFLVSLGHVRMIYSWHFNALKKKNCSSASLFAAGVVRLSKYCVFRQRRGISRAVDPASQTSASSPRPPYPTTSPPPLFGRNAAHPSRATRRTNGSRRFALGAGDVCPVVRNPTCSIQAWWGCEGLPMAIRLRPRMA